MIERVGALLDDKIKLSIPDDKIRIFDSLDDISITPKSWESPITLLDDRAGLENQHISDDKVGRHFDQLIMDDIVTGK